MAISPTTIAVLNTNPDVAEAIAETYRLEGHNVVVALIPTIKEKKIDMDDFFKEINPSFVIVDVSHPHEDGWNFFQQLRQLKSAEGRRFVVTTTGARILAEVAGPNLDAPVVEKPYSIERLLEVISEGPQIRGEREL